MKLRQPALPFSLLLFFGAGVCHAQTYGFLQVYIGSSVAYDSSSAALSGMSYTWAEYDGYEIPWADCFVSGYIEGPDSYQGWADRSSPDFAYVNTSGTADQSGTYTEVGWHSVTTEWGTVYPGESSASVYATWQETHLRRRSTPYTAVARTRPTIRRAIIHGSRERRCTSPSREATSGRARS